MPYPEIDDPAFVQKLMAKREFAEHAAVEGSDDMRTGDAATAEAAWSARCERGAFELTDVQMIVRNFLAPGTPYRNLLLFHGVGLGKTCTAVTVAERFAEAGAGERDVLVITRAGLHDAFRQTVFDMSKVARRPDGTLDFAVPTQCTGSAYPDAVIDRRTMTDEQVDTRVQRAVRARYAFVGPNQFANQVDAATRGLPPALANERLRERYSKMLIIVDEAHALRGDDAKRAAPTLRRVLSCTDNVKLLMMTATPMFNRASDVLDLVNLMLANDKRPPLKTSEVFDRDSALVSPEGETKLRAACRGYVSYMKGGDPYSFPLRLWPSSSRDPAVVDAFPAIDIKGRPLRSSERVGLLRRGTFEIVATPMGTGQREVYEAAEGRIRGEDGDEDEDMGEGEEEEGPPGSSTMRASMQASTIVYPGSPSVGGRAAFNHAFRRVGAGRPMQVEYRPGVKPFLERPEIRSHAPKIDAVVRRVLSSEGVVLVYSRFLWSGLVPLAIALESEGMSRFDAPPMLAAARGPGNTGANAGAGAGRGWSYVIISGERDVKTDDARAVAALTGAANRDGGVVKVALVSDRGSEGLDLRFMREVHVLEPWYHINKIEQVVGRASRFCSHADLPLGRRNLTVYLHAAVRPRSWGGADVESVDLRAYRIGLHKQRRIDAVERVLREVAIDCTLNRARMTSAPTRFDVTTSQGVTLKGHRLGGREGGERRMCDPDVLKGPKGPVGRSRDDSTYDPAKHASHRHAYRRLLLGYFSTVGTASATFEQLWRHVEEGFPRRVKASRDRAAFELNEIVEREVEVVGPRGGRTGRMLHRGDRYVFQPTDEDTTVLSDSERTAPRRRAPVVLDARQMLLAAPTAPSASDLGRSLALDARSEIAAAVLAELADSVQALQARLGLPNPAAFQRGALDWVVDRLPHDGIVRVACACLLPKEAAKLLPKRLQVLKAQAAASMRSAGMIVRVAEDGAEIRSPYSDAALCFDEETGEAKPCSSQSVSPGGTQRRVVPPGTIGVMVALKREGRAVFKVLDEEGGNKGTKDHRDVAAAGRGSGSVCHQSSAMTSQRLQMLVADAAGGAVKIGGVAAGVDKRILCDLYEVVLRQLSPSSVVRYGPVKLK